MDPLWQAALIALWIVVLGLALLLVGTLRQIGLLELRLGDDPGALLTDDGLERGEVAPEFKAVELESNATIASANWTSSPRMIVFVSTSCVACQKLMPHLNEVAATRESEFDFVVICVRSETQCRAFQNTNHVNVRMLVDRAGDIARLFKVPATPFTYVTDHEGRVLTRGVANDWRGLESLLREEGTLQSGSPWSRVGDAAASGISLSSVDSVAAQTGRFNAQRESDE